MVSWQRCRRTLRAFDGSWSTGHCLDRTQKRWWTQDVRIFLPEVLECHWHAVALILWSIIRQTFWIWEETSLAADNASYHSKLHCYFYFRFHVLLWKLNSAWNIARFFVQYIFERPCNQMVDPCNQVMLNSVTVICVCIYVHIYVGACTYFCISTLPLWIHLPFVVSLPINFSNTAVHSASCHACWPRADLRLRII